MSDASTTVARARDVEFEISMLTPEQALHQYPEQVGAQPHAPNTSVYAVCKCETVRGPFVCILPLDGRVALLERDLAKKLVSMAYDELARKWVQEGYDRA